MALLEIEKLQTHFRTPEGVVRAVNGLSFSIGNGETVALVGESGSGKSVTSLSILRLLPEPPARIRGSIRFLGHDLLSLSEAEIRRLRGGDIGMIFQEPMTALNPVLTVGTQIVETIRLHQGLSKREALERAEQMLAMVGIPEPRRRLNEYPYQFSGGMRQRAMIAIALACNPKLLIADEPTTALDVTVQAQILELISGICSEFGTALILITHDLGVVAGMTDRVIVMYAGRVIEEAPTEELFANPRHPYTLGLLNSVPRLDEAGHSELRTIEGAPPDLLRPPTGCRFMPRCFYARNICRQMPPLESLAGHSEHRKACWLDVTDPKEQAHAEQRRQARIAAQRAALEAAMSGDKSSSTTAHSA